MLKFLVFAITLHSVQGFSALPPHHSSICTAQVFGLRGYHRLREGSKLVTDSAFRRLLYFRNHVLTHETNEDAVFQDFSVQGSKANAKERETVAQQIDGLALQYRVPQYQEQLNLIAGTTLTGAEKIKEYLQWTQTSAAELSTFRKPRFKEDMVEYGQILWHDVASVLLTFSMAQASLAILQNPTEHSPMWLLAGVPILSFYSERMLRIAQARHWLFNSQQKTQMRFLDQDRGDWIFTSRTYRLPLSFMTLLWNSGEPLEFSEVLALRKADRMTDALRAVVKGLLKAFYQNAPEQIEDFVTIDQLLTRHPETREPELVVFIRSSIERPQGRKRRLFPQSEWGYQPTSFERL